MVVTFYFYFARKKHELQYKRFIWFQYNKVSFNQQNRPGESLILSNEIESKGWRERDLQRLGSAPETLTEGKGRLETAVQVPAKFSSYFLHMTLSVHHIPIVRLASPLGLSITHTVLLLKGGKCFVFYPHMPQHPRGLQNVTEHTEILRNLTQLYKIELIIL